MRLKKFNAGVSLLTTIALVIHMGYSVFAYLTFYYDPVLKLATAIPFMLLACLHAVCAMAAVFLLSDGTRLDLYPKQNLRTILQRVSAALILPLLILHINTFDLLRKTSEGGMWLFFALLILTQPLFYGTVLTHIAVSLTRALISLGWLSDRETQKRLDRIIYIVCALAFAAAVFAVIKTELAMFVSAGGAA